MQILKRIHSTVTDQMPVVEFQSSETIQTRLYTCTDCAITYIASEMDSCPECQMALEEVPSGSELGYTSVEP